MVTSLGRRTTQNAASPSFSCENLPSTAHLTQPSGLCFREFAHNPLGSGFPIDAEFRVKFHSLKPIGRHVSEANQNA